MKVFFILFVILHGQKPIPHQQQVPDIGDCLAMVAEFLDKKPPQGGGYQVGCAVVDSSEGP